jgi:hypothetical protein
MVKFLNSEPKPVSVYFDIKEKRKYISSSSSSSSSLSIKDPPPCHLSHIRIRAPVQNHKIKT